MQFGIQKFAIVLALLFKFAIHHPPGTQFNVLAIARPVVLLCSLVIKGSPLQIVNALEFGLDYESIYLSLNLNSLSLITYIPMIVIKIWNIKIWETRSLFIVVICVFYFLCKIIPPAWLILLSTLGLP